MRQLLIVRVPWLEIPAPPSVLMKPLAMVIPDMETVVPELTEMHCTALLPLTVTWDTPGPVMVMFFVTASVLPKVIVRAVAKKVGSNVTVPPEAVSIKACRRDPAPLSLAFVTAVAQALPVRRQTRAAVTKRDLKLPKPMSAPEGRGETRRAGEKKKRMPEFF